VHTLTTTIFSEPALLMAVRGALHTVVEAPCSQAQLCRQQSNTSMLSAASAETSSSSSSTGSVWVQMKSTNGILRNPNRRSTVYREDKSTLEESAI
jgi:hypothetical protein